ncbi:MAG TPA: radical SAM protein, partial [Candidatus Limiplasma sp.]|nr:radical SAM protein [Candidatus Limiplasma sp.]
MRCRYCFYEDEAKHRQFADYGLMSEDTLETVIRKSLAQAQGSCTFGFQGGEPTLRGLPFFQKAMALQKQYKPDGLTVMNAIQTNGLLIDDAWAEFFREHRFLVGLSVDGTSKIHNQNRVDADGNGTLRRAMEAARRLKAHRVEFNLLTVVTNDTAERVDRIFDFFMRQGLVWQQYIPCLDAWNRTETWLEPKQYGKFLIGLFDLWAREVLAG